MAKKLKERLPEKLTVDPDIEAMSHEDLQQWVMERRLNIRLGAKALELECNESYFYDLIRAIISVLPKEDQDNYKPENFKMQKRQILWVIN